MNKLMNLSPFFPAYNEEGNVEKMVEAFRSVLPHVADDYEIIIVNGGSKDRTGEIADRLAQGDGRIRVVHHERNLGYGAAIQSGVKACQKEYVFFTDEDNQFDVSQLSLFVSFIGSIVFNLSAQLGCYDENRSV